MIWLVGVLAITIIIIFASLSEGNTEESRRRDEEQKYVFEQADILSRQVRYEKKALYTRITQIVGQVFNNYKVINNLILMDEKGVEHQIPVLCATRRGVILFQTADYPGKALFGTADGAWQIAQSSAVAQVVPNAGTLAIENAMLIKRLTGIDVKPIAVISKYTPAITDVLSDEMGERVITEDQLEYVLKDLKLYGNQRYPLEFLQQVKKKLVSLHVDDEGEGDEEDDFEPAVDC